MLDKQVLEAFRRRLGMRLHEPIKVIRAAHNDELKVLARGVYLDLKLGWAPYMCALMSVQSYNFKLQTDPYGWHEMLFKEQQERYYRHLEYFEDFNTYSDWKRESPKEAKPWLNASI